MGEAFRVMTYNVHSCKGSDGLVSPERTAELISFYQPDIIALQEVRVGRIHRETIDHPRRVKEAMTEPTIGEPPAQPPEVIPKRTPSGSQDRLFVNQPETIARALGMKYFFYPLVRMTEEDYGLAFLSRYPFRLIRAGNLPTLARRRPLEKRGAVWCAVRAGNFEIQVLNTHLGLNRIERMAQMEALLGDEWSIHPEFRQPFIICGDLNARPGQPAYKRLGRSLLDVQLLKGGWHPRKTWPSFFPIFRIDHIFVPKNTQVLAVEVASHPLARLISDHLPLIADIVLEPEGTAFATDYSSS